MKITKRTLTYNLNFAAVGLLVICLFLVSCSEKSEIPTIEVQEIHDSDDEIFLKHWKILGPINLDSTKIHKGTLPIDIDGLMRWGIKEDSTNTDDFNLLAREKQNQTSNKVTVNQEYHSDNSVIFYASLNRSGETDLSLSYAMTVVHSSVEQDVTIFTGAADFMKIWVNDCLLYRKVEWSPTVRSYKALSVHLKKGENKFLVKIWNHNSKWSFYLSLASIKKGKEIYLNKQNGNFLETSLLKPNSPIKFELNKTFFKDIAHFIVDFKDVVGNVKYNRRIAFNKSKFSIPGDIPINQAYTFTVKLGKDSISQQVYIGDTTNLVRSIKSLRSQAQLPQKELDNLDAVLIRYDYLLEYETENGKDDYLQRKLAFCLYEMASIKYRSENGLEISKNVPGLHMRSYISKIDGTKQFYMIYIPKSYDSKKPLPLVTEMPWVADNFRHFLKGWRVADLYRTNMVIRQAEKFNYAYLWSCSRTYNKSNYTSISSTATLEEIEAVKMDYNIAPDKLFLIGTCLGGGNAILFASKYPKMFAAVGVTGPALEKLKLQPLENFKNLPVYIEHSQWDGKASFELSKMFARNVKEIGGKVEFVDLGYLQSDILVNFYPQDLILSHIFNFFKDKYQHKDLDTVVYTSFENKYAPRNSWINLLAISINKKATIEAIKDVEKINISTKNIQSFSVNSSQFKLKDLDSLNIYVNKKLVFSGKPSQEEIIIGDRKYLDNKNKFTEGPIHDVFSDSFYLVPGTIGNKAEAELNQLYQSKLAKMWNEDFNGDCRIIKDIDLSQNLFLNNNLVLIGNSKTNSILKRLSATIKQKQKVIAIKTQSKKVPMSAYVLPNPYNKRKYLLIITAEDLKDFKHLEYRPWYDGDMDFVSFDKGLKKGSGLFNQNWN